MPRAHLGAVGRRATIATAIALSLSSIPAHAVMVDGNLSDLITAVGSSALNTASGTDFQGAIDNTENANGFDIQDMYAYYDLGADTLFLGFNTYGTAGNSGGSDTNPSAFGTMSFGVESYSFQINNNNGSLFTFDVFAPSLLPGYTNTVNPYGAPVTANWAVNTTLDGVEFSLTNLSGLLSAASTPLPESLIITLKAGSGENMLNEDVGTLSLQAVPVPAAAWLFGSGLVGLMATARARRPKP